MAFRRRFSGSRRRTSSPTNRTRPRWLGSSFDVTLTAAAPALGVSLFTATTPAVGAAALEQEVKLLRVVGRVTTRTLAATAAAGPVGIGILKSQFPTTIVPGGFQDPLISTNLGTVDWLRLMTHEVPPNAGANAYNFVQDIDVTVQRWLKSVDSIAMMFIQGLGVDSVVITVDIRILIVIRI